MEGQERERSRVWGHIFLQWLLLLPKSHHSSEIEVSRKTATEAPTDREIMELPAKELGSELEGNDPQHRGYYESDGKFRAAIYAIGHDPEKPVELRYRLSAREDPMSNPMIQQCMDTELKSGLLYRLTHNQARWPKANEWVSASRLSILLARPRQT